MKNEIKSTRGKMINLLLKDYLHSIIFSYKDSNEVKTEIENLMESNFKFTIKISDINILNSSSVSYGAIMGQVYFEDVDGSFKSIDFHVAHKQIEMV